MSEQIEARLVSLIEAFRGRIPDGFIEETISLATHREWGVALENLCVQLYEYDVEPSEQEFEEIKRLGFSMNMSEEAWNFLLSPN